MTEASITGGADVVSAGHGAMKCLQVVSKASRTENDGLGR